MKRNKRFLLFSIAVIALWQSACGPTATPTTLGGPTPTPGATPTPAPTPTPFPDAPQALSADTPVGQISGIHVDSAGRIYIANGSLFRVNDINGGGGVQYLKHSGARDVFVADPMLFTAGSGDKVRFSQVDGSGFDDFGPHYPVSGLLNQPQGIVFAHNKIFFSDTSNNLVERMDDMNGGGLTDPIQCGFFGAPMGLAHDSGDNLYIAFAGGHYIGRLNTTSLDCSVTLGNPETPGSGVREFNKPTDVALDSSGRLYIADAGNNRIIRVDNFAGDGWTELKTFGPGGTGTFSDPRTVFVDSTGAIYVGDFGNRRILKFPDITGATFTELKTLRP